MAPPDKEDIEEKAADTEERITTYVDYGIMSGLGNNEHYHDGIPVRMKDMIMQVLNRYSGELYELTPDGEEQYGGDKSLWDTLHCIVRIQDAHEHWYTLWSMWSD